MAEAVQVDRHHREGVAVLQHLFDALKGKLAVGQAGQGIVLAGVEQLLAGIVQRRGQHRVAKVQ
ncbi:hypothetical protein D3C71_1841470 [compost metagenome]